MNEFLPRTEPAAPVGSATERMATGVRAIAPVAAAASRAESTSGSPDLQRPAQGEAGAFAMVDDDRTRAAADYARVHARIVSVLADLNAPSAPAEAPALASAEKSLLSLIPQPAVVLPLPPANRDMVEFVVQVTRTIARQAAQTRAAQSGASVAMVGAAVA